MQSYLKFLCENSYNADRKHTNFFCIKSYQDEHWIDVPSLFRLLEKGWMFIENGLFLLEMGWDSQKHAFLFSSHFWTVLTGNEDVASHF